MPKGEYPIERRHHGKQVSLAERFWVKVDRNGPVPAHAPELGPCWVWTAATFTSGKLKYGQFQFNGKPTPAHRVAWFLGHGVLPEHQVAHRCDNTLCVRPEHLFEATALENNRDMNAKGRNPRSGKLTEDQVREIVRRRAEGETGTALAQEFGVSDGQISMIWTRREWSVVGADEVRPELPRGGHQQKLTADDVREIRRLYADGVPQVALAKRFNVSSVNIHGVVRGKLWTHIR